MVKNGWDCSTKDDGWLAQALAAAVNADGQALQCACSASRCVSQPAKSLGACHGGGCGQATAGAALRHRRVLVCVPRPSWKKKATASHRGLQQVQGERREQIARDG